MKKKIILILLSDHKSTSEEIILSSLNLLKKRKHIYLFIGNSFFFKNLAKKTYVINNFNHLDEKKINFFNVNSKNISMFNYINLITDVSINLLNKKKAVGMINMPLNKDILSKKAFGYTEFLAKKLGQIGNENMLLFSDNLSVCPLTTHIPLRKVTNFINKNKIINAINNINHFYKKIIKKKIKIKVCTLNPHGATDFYNKFNEEKKTIIPALNSIKKMKRNVSGPYSADTIFFRYQGNAIIGMYHDQVLTPFKTIKGFNAINVSIGLKYLRLSPSHGTGLDILKNKKKISNESFKYCIKFCEKYL